MPKVTVEQFMALTEAIANEDARADKEIEQWDATFDMTEIENRCRDLLFLKRAVARRLRKNTRHTCVTNDILRDIRDFLEAHAEHIEAVSKKVLEGILETRHVARAHQFAASHLAS